jgi:hypothetical protein
VGGIVGVEVDVRRDDDMHGHRIECGGEVEDGPVASGVVGEVERVVHELRRFRRRRTRSKW